MILGPGSSVQTLWRNMQIQRGVCNLLSRDHDHFVEEVHEFITAEVKVILCWGMLLFRKLCDSIKKKCWIVLLLHN